MEEHPEVSEQGCPVAIVGLKQIDHSESPEDGLRSKDNSHIKVFSI